MLIHHLKDKLWQLNASPPKNPTRFLDDLGDRGQHRQLVLVPGVVAVELADDPGEAHVGAAANV